MPRLSESDYRSALEVLREAVAVDGPCPFPEPVLVALHRLVPCDVVAYHEGRPIAEPALVFTGEPRGEMTPETRAAHQRHLDQDPLTPVEGARKYSDFLSRRELHRLELYQEVSRPTGVEDMIRLWLDPDGAGNARLEFDRPDWGFRERDRTVLDFLLPHLRQFRRNAAARRRLSAGPPGAAGRLTPREREILELVAEGRTNAEVARLLWISPGTVRKHLENAYESLGVHTRTAAVAALAAPDGQTV
ncbi:MAG TPA: helix-turn-helix transcriptional regulator [Gaiellaceae bacterium]